MPSSLPARAVFALAAVLAVASTSPAQQDAFADTTLLAAMKWRDIGPMRGGRSVAVAGSSSRPFEYWMGTTGGGVFKTTDAGITWTPVADKYYGGTIGAIAVAESNPDIVYVGTGESPIRGNVSHGDGVWKTIDGGRTWTHLGLTETRQISRVRIHPRNPDVVWIGAQGHVFGPNAERGVFKTTDGGKTWRKVLFRNDSTGITDLALDPTNSDVLYAAFWQSGRTPWMLVSGGAGSGIFKSTDGGETWREITRHPGLPSGIIGNIGITVSPVRPSRVWAIIEADSGGVFRSDDAGATWTRLNDERKLRQRAWYYMRIYADTKDSNSVYVSNVAFQRSTDGGKTWRNVATPHGDSHDLWIAPNDNLRLVEGNDGGANVSFNRGRTWSEQDYSTAQFYHVTTTNHWPYKVCGAQQDNSTVCIASRAEGGINFDDWYRIAGGESGYIAVRPDNPDITYGGSYGGYLTRHDAKRSHERAINPWPINPMGHSAGDVKYRFQWTYPIVVSPHDPNTLYATANVVFKTTNEGQSWTVISPDLTRADPKTLGPSGGPITKDQTSVEYYATIFAFAESPRVAGVLWAGSDDGLIHLSRDAGKTWTNVTPPDMAPFTRVSIIEPSPFDPGTAYVAANRYQLDDMRPYVWKTTDHGRRWTRIDAGIAADEFTRVIRADPVRRGLLYAGTERGVWVSFDDGARWQRLQLNLPPVPVHDLAVEEGDLVAGTHGRGFWILDDLSPLRQLTTEVATRTSHLFHPRPAHRVSWGGGFAEGRSAHPLGANPPSGAIVWFTLAKGGEEVTLDILDSRGKTIQSYSSKLDSAGLADSVRADSIRRARGDTTRRIVTPDSTQRLEARSEEAAPEEERGRGGPRRPRVPNKQGLNQFVWDLRYPDATTFKDIILWAGSTRGPVAAPGTYSVRLTVGGRSLTQPLVLRKDPRSPATLADLQAQFAFLIRIRDEVSKANDAVRTIRNVRHQVTERGKRLTGDVAGRYAEATRGILERLAAVEGEIYQVKNRSNQDPLNYPIKLNNKLSALMGVVANGDGRPTAQSRAAFQELSGLLGAELARLARVLEEDLPRANAVLADAGVEQIRPSTAELGDSAR